MKTFSSLEPLEDRIAPAGIVTATFAAGKLTLTGDAVDNVLSIAAVGADTFQITGGGGTKIALNGAGAIAMLTLEGPLKQLAASMGLGADSLSLLGASISGGVTVEGGEGADSLSMSEGVFGPVSFNGGLDGDSFSVSGSRFTASKLTINLGEGSNSVSLNATSTIIPGGIDATGGSGTDSFSFNGSNIVSGSIKVVTGDGDGSITLSPSSLTVAGSVTFSRGAHASTSVTSSISPSSGLITGSVTETTGPGDVSDTISGSTSLVIGGGVSLTSNSGDDSFTFGGSNLRIGGSVKVLAGDGANSLTCSAANFSAKDLSYTGGNGMETLSLNGSNLQIGGAVNLVLGAGNESISMSPSVVSIGGLVKITAGSGSHMNTFGGSSANFAKGITAILGDSSNTDSFSLSGTSFTSGGPISLVTGASTSSHSLTISPSHVAINGGFSATFGAGSVSSSINSGDLFIKGALVLKASGGSNDSFTFSGTSARLPGGLSITGDADGYFASFSYTAIDAGAFTFNGGAGAEMVSVTGGGDIRGGLTAKLGAGMNSLTMSGFADGLRVKSLTYLSDAGGSDSDSLSLTNVNALGAVIATLGLGNSSVTVNDSVLTSFTLSTRGGADSVSIENTSNGIVSRFLGAVKILLGDGMDTLTIGNNSATGKADFRSTVSIDGGTATDTFNDLANLYLAGQPVKTNIP